MRVNLLSQDSQADPFPELDEGQRARFEERARSLFGLDWTHRPRSFDLFAEMFAAELEELDTSPSLEAANDLIDRIDRERRRMLADRAGPPDAATGALAARGRWLCYWPGRSLETGEAEIASRGFFDVRDRPPLALWTEAIARRNRTRPDRFEVAVLCWVPPGEVERAAEGRNASVAATLAFLDEVSDALMLQADRVSASRDRD